MIQVQDLIKKYGAFTAVNGINLSVERGQIHGFLGPTGPARRPASA